MPLPNPTFHQVFVHTVLRSLAHSKPAETILSLMSPSRDALLKAVDHDTASLLNQKDSGFDIGQVLVHGFRIAGRPTVIIQMPPPARCPEAHFVAIVLQKATQGAVRKSDLAGAGIDYITLEESKTHAGAPETMLGSWASDGTHSNLGAGPEATLEAFRECLKRLYEKC